MREKSSFRLVQAVLLIACLALALSANTREAQAGGCGNGVAVNTFGSPPAFVGGFGYQQPVFVNAAFGAQGVFVAAPQVNPFFVQAVPFHQQRVFVNAGRQVQVINRRGVFGRNVTVTTIR